MLSLVELYDLFILWESHNVYCYSISQPYFPFIQCLAFYIIVCNHLKLNPVVQFWNICPQDLQMSSFHLYIQLLDCQCSIKLNFSKTPELTRVQYLFNVSLTNWDMQTEISLSWTWIHSECTCTEETLKLTDTMCPICMFSVSYYKLLP